MLGLDSAHLALISLCDQFRCGGDTRRSLDPQVAETIWFKLCRDFGSGLLPMGSRSLRLLNQAAHSRVREIAGPRS